MLVESEKLVLFLAAYGLGLLQEACDGRLWKPRVAKKRLEEGFTLEAEGRVEAAREVRSSWGKSLVEVECEFHDLAGQWHRCVAKLPLIDVGQVTVGGSISIRYLADEPTIALVEETLAEQPAPPSVFYRWVILPVFSGLFALLAPDFLDRLMMS